MNKIQSIIFSLLAFTSFGQDTLFREYDIEKIPPEHVFLKLTKRESKIDQSGEEHHISRLKSMKDGTAFIRPLTEVEIEKHIEAENLMYFRFKDNRGRFDIDTYVNKIKDTSSRNQMWTKTMCYLNSDSTIDIMTGNGIFGFESINIKIDKQHYYSKYYFDIGEEKIFKSSHSDSVLTNEIEVTNSVSSLKLNDNPTFESGEQLLGSLTFKTDDFLRDVEYDHLLSMDNYEGNLFDEIYVAGTVFFTCKTKRITDIEQISTE